MNVESHSSLIVRDQSTTLHVFAEGATKADKIYNLSQYIPQNEFGLPVFFLRSDMLPSDAVSHEDVDAASVGLFYYEGYPTLEGGASFWNQLPHEPYAQYVLFEKYLDQAAEIGIRQLDMLSVDTGVDVGTLSEHLREFYWTARARAYDLFLVAAEAKKRQHRVRKMENTHYVEADKLFAKLMERFTGENADWIEELNAKEAMEVLETLVKIQRMSVGLTGQHASSTSRDFGQGESSEGILRKLAQGGGMSASSGDKFAATLQHLLDDPEGGQVLQAAIIKVTAPNNSTTFDDSF